MKKVRSQIIAILIVLSILLFQYGCDKVDQRVDVDLDGTDIWTPNPK
jgi:hypothetical protein